MKLPELEKYRAKYIKKGVKLPLSNSLYFEDGIISKLPITTKYGWPWNEETDPKLYDKEIVWPKLTIVTPSYNQVGFLEETIRSILLQNYPNLEYIIIDGGSTDGSIEIIKKYAPYISYWESEQDRGQGHAINKGFSLSSGNYHAWINSDDYYLKGIFNVVVTSFMKTKSMFIYGYGYNYSTENQVFHLAKVLPIIDYFIKIPGILQPSTFWSSTIHQPIWEELHCALDFELWMRLVKGNKRKLIKLPLSVANEHSLAKTFDNKMKHKWEEDHQKIWAEDAYGRVHNWNWISLLNRIRIKIYKLVKLYE